MAQSMKVIHSRIIPVSLRLGRPSFFLYSEYQPASARSGRYAQTRKKRQNAYNLRPPPHQKTGVGRRLQIKSSKSQRGRVSQSIHLVRPVGRQASSPSPGWHRGGGYRDGASMTNGTILFTGGGGGAVYRPRGPEVPARRRKINHRAYGAALSTPPPHSEVNVFATHGSAEFAHFVSDPTDIGRG